MTFLSAFRICSLLHLSTHTLSLSHSLTRQHSSLKFFLQQITTTTATTTMSKQHQQHQVVKTTYTSQPVSVPELFLQSTPSDARPILCTTLDFSQTPVPEFKGCHAIMLDHVLSPSECAQLIRLAEASVREEDYTKDGTDPWQPARVNVGPGLEVLMPEYRSGDRIIWDEQVVVDRLWERIARGIPDLAVDDTDDEEKKKKKKRQHVLKGFNEDDIGGMYKKSGRPSMDWKFHRVNKRMRFLRYRAGNFFRPHCDGPYGETGPNGEALRTWFTVHVYLNDSKDGIEEDPAVMSLTKEERDEKRKEVELVGGATDFLSSDEERKISVHPRAGRVLLFQHRRLYHSGADVFAGTKYTVRTDVLFELQREEEEDK
jgi:hypothetical protein